MRTTAILIEIARGNNYFTILGLIQGELISTIRTDTRRRLNGLGPFHQQKIKASVQSMK